MKVQLWDKLGNSELVVHQEVQARLKDGWSYNKPSVLQTSSAKAKASRVKRIVPKKAVVEVDEVVALKSRTNVSLDGPQDLTNNEEAE